jgi:hypothetical protein
MIPDEVRAHVAARLAETASEAADALERLNPERLALSDEPSRDMRREADRLYRRIIGMGA